MKTRTLLIVLLLGLIAGALLALDLLNRGLVWRMLQRTRPISHTDEITFV